MKAPLFAAFALNALCLIPWLNAREGIIPVDAEGKPLNLGFEDGSLKDWKAEGQAFEGQPVEGDKVSVRRPEMKSGHDGRFWIGTFEKFGDPPTGTLTSVPFRVTHQWASFLAGAGPAGKGRVEIVDVASGKVVHSAAGREREELELVVVDLSKQQGKEILIRIVDAGPGHWSHVNFDDFRFHDQPPKAAPRRVLAGGPPPQAGATNPLLSPQEALKKMEVPPGFSVDLIASEPDLVQPIAFCWDARGRIWVVEGRTYPRRAGNPPKPRADDAGGLDKPTPEQIKDIFGGNDRILILGDEDGDGKFESRKVFAENLNLVSGIELGFGGVYVGAAPYLLHFPLDDKTDKPAGDPRILTDGWGWQDTHETLNSFIWGPDGWLYGCHGVFTHSEVRVCGDAGVSSARTAGVSPANREAAGQDARGTRRQDAGITKRTPINCGYWRFHPVRHEFEVFAQGTSNAWGLDYNEFGDWFSEACVIPHFWHIIQGGYYLRQSNPLGHFNPYVYTNIETIADHVHYIGTTPHSGNAVSDAAGGGHAHSGLCIYNGDNFPPEYRGRAMIFNIHGQRINQEQLVPKGSGYVAKHLPDFLKTNDKNFTGVALKTGPDGAVYFIDWYDQQKCHRVQPEVWDRSNGRMYRVKYDKTWKPWKGDLAKAAPKELANLHKSKNGWLNRMSRKGLCDRSTTALDRTASLQLRETVAEGTDIMERLAALWTLATTNDMDHVDRATAATEFPGALQRFAVAAFSDKTDAGRLPWQKIIGNSDPPLRLTIASALQRLPLDQRWDIAETLIQHGEDAGDHNLPQMYWYAIEPLVPADPALALAMAQKSKIPLVAQNIARRVADSGETALGHLVGAMAKEKTAGGLTYLMKATLEGLKGRSGVKTPENWDSAYTNIQEVAEKRPDAKERAEELVNLRTALAVAFGDQRVFPSLREQVLDAGQPDERRQSAFETLVRGKDPEIGALVLRLLDDPKMRLTALRALPQATEGK
ncbi:MAG: PVC-type heme-binding CxxCH protein [Verrucomicrobiales bacterium]